jgi:hypothetical protein
VIRNTTTVRAPKRAKEHLRAAVLMAGHELLVERGLEGGATSVPLNAAITRASEKLGERITPASVYGRIWDSQTSFQSDVLLEAARAYPSGEEGPTARAAQKIIDRADRSTLALRRSALDEVWRVAGAVHVEVLESSRSWQLWVGVWALTVSTPSTADDEILGPALREGDQTATDAVREVLVQVTAGLGFQPKAPLSIDDFAVAVSCLAEGFALRQRFGPKRHLVRLPTPNGDGHSTWPPFTLALRALADSYLEPIPRWSAPSKR